MDRLEKRLLARIEAKKAFIREYENATIGEVFTTVLDSVEAKTWVLNILGNPTDVTFTQVNNFWGAEVQHLLEIRRI